MWYFSRSLNKIFDAERKDSSNDYLSQCLCLFFLVVRSRDFQTLRNHLGSTIGTNLYSTIKSISSNQGQTGTSSVNPVFKGGIIVISSLWVTLDLFCGLEMEIRAGKSWFVYLSFSPWPQPLSFRWLYFFSETVRNQWMETRFLHWYCCHVASNSETSAQTTAMTTAETSTKSELRKRCGQPGTKFCFCFVLCREACDELWPLFRFINCL